MTRILALAFALFVSTNVLAAESAAWQWKKWLDDPDRLYLYKDGVQVGAYCYKTEAYMNFKDGTWEMKRVDAPVAIPEQSNQFVDALNEVNATRASRGLPPYILDENLALGAQAVAEFRAARLMAGHTGNDFAALPAGTLASAGGCAAWDPGMGWGSCCTYDRYTYAGAGWAMGRDGKRYMYIFVR